MPVQSPSHPTALKVLPVPEALLTPFARGPLNTEQGPARWVSGAVHDRTGKLVIASQRRWHGGRQSAAAADPTNVVVPPDLETLPGTWIYAGHWSRHFGHFLLEMLPNLWPPASDRGEIAGIITHRQPRGPEPVLDPPEPLDAPELKAWQRDLLDLAGYPGTPLRVVHGVPVRVERLLVPERPVLLKQEALPEAVALWQRISETVGRRGPHRHLYLSRTRFHSSSAAGAGRARTDAEWDSRVDATFAAAGYVVVHPETLPIAEQIALVRGAEVLAGASGSALHLSVFAAPGTHVVALGDEKSATRPVLAQTMVDQAIGHSTHFVAHQDLDGIRQLIDGLG